MILTKTVEEDFHHRFGIIYMPKTIGFPGNTTVIMPAFERSTPSVAIGGTV